MKIKCKKLSLIGFISIVVFGLLCSVNLTKQGLYYDELHQAAGAFYYQNGFEYEKNTPYLFTRVSATGIPVLNMSYSGALKTGLYGLYLKLFNVKFNVFNWRIFGIIFVSIGIFVFILATSQRLYWFGTLFFLLFFLTDITVILATRHDWGPVALAMSIRLIFLALWLYGETKEMFSKSLSFFLGLIVGIAIFEKLTSMVLILPLIIIFILSPAKKNKEDYIFCVLGFTIGSLPLIMLNLVSFVKFGYFISLENTANNYRILSNNFLIYFTKYLSLGAGSIVKDFILGEKTTISEYLEIILIFGILIVTAILNYLYRRENKVFRLSNIMLLCYLTVGVSLYFIPAPTWVNHWIIGTPFQYTAISLSLCGLHCLGFRGKKIRNKLIPCSFAVLVAFMVVYRMVGLISLESSFAAGKASIHWDPSLSEIGQFASDFKKEAVFVAADWGIATQIFCLSNGHPDVVYEPFWNYKGLDQIKDFLKKSKKKIFYLVTINPKSNVRPQNTFRILEDIIQLKNWREAPLESELKKFKAVNIRKYLMVAKESA